MKKKRRESEKRKWLPFCYVCEIKTKGEIHRYTDSHMCECKNKGIVNMEVTAGLGKFSD